jgi:putative SAM-dependent methyltransferase
MQVFDLVKTVLDENYDKITGTEKEKDARIAHQLNALSSAYSELKKKNSLDYGRPKTRFAYLYRYVTSHANLVYQRIRSSKPLRKLFENDQVAVSCVGGGPGSDLVGILKYLAELPEDKPIPVLRCHILDGENAWADAWSDVDQKLETDCKISTYFLQMDVTNSDSWAKHSKYLNADLFTMIYFASEIYSRRDSAKPFFDHLLTHMKLGALLLYIDNNSECFTDWFDGLIASNGLEPLDANEAIEKMTVDEEKQALGKYLKKFGAVKLEANAAYRICRKT